MDFQAPLNPTELFTSKGLVVVITGGGSGIGLAIASALYQNGASKIYLLGRRQNVLEEAIKTLESSSAAPASSTSVLSAISCDVSDISSINTAIKQIGDETSYVDVLINNAGVIGPENGYDLYKTSSLSDLQGIMLKDFDKWDQTLAINTKSIVGVSASFLPLLDAANTRRGWKSGKVTGTGISREHDKTALQKLGFDNDDDRTAQIITIASIASFMRYSTAGFAYNASKAGAAQLGKILASVLSEWGIRSNIVCPGPYPSEMTAGLDPGYGTNQVPLGRMGNINDIASLLLYLTGKGGAYANGTVNLTDGGRTSVFPSTF